MVLLALIMRDWKTMEGLKKKKKKVIPVLQSRNCCDKPIYLQSFKTKACSQWKFVLPGPSTTTETETIAKYEIMDGAPVKGKYDTILKGKHSQLKLYFKENKSGGKWLV